MTAPSHRSFEQAVPLDRPEDLVGFETSLPVPAVRRRPPLAFVVAVAFVLLLIAAATAPSLFTHFDPLVGDFTEGLKPPGWPICSALIALAATSLREPSMAPGTRF